MRIDMAEKRRGFGEKERKVVCDRHLQAFFHERVRDVLARQEVPLDEATEFYLVNMLSEFIRSEQLFEEGDDGRRDSVPLAFLVKRALEQPPAERVRTYRKLGDKSLYVSGFFSDSLDRSLVDIDYYVEMGGRAYGSAADLVENARGSERVFHRIFDELASKFRRLVDCLMEISEEASLTGPTSLVRLYERWVHTRSERLARRLVEQGILPKDPRGSGGGKA